jgi:transposase
MKRSYQTDLTDAQWEAIEPHIPAANKRGPPRIHGSREILNAVFYVLNSGCPWRLLPKDFPPWETLYSWFRKWRTHATFERLNASLRERLRSSLGRDPLPSAGIADSQSRPRAPGWAANREDTTATREGSGQKKAPTRGHEDYERLCASAEAFVYAAMIRLMVRRLARA